MSYLDRVQLWEMTWIVSAVPSHTTFIVSEAHRTSVGDQHPALSTSSSKHRRRMPHDTTQSA